jgi:hypothetical protein
MSKNPKRVAAGKRSKSKGNNNERALAAEFRTWWGKGEWARTPSSGGWATAAHREAFRTCGDIITTAEDFPFCVEAKKQEGWDLDQLLHNDSCVILKWWKQTCDETPVGMLPLLVFARNHVPQSVMFDSSRVEEYAYKLDDARVLEPGVDTQFARDQPAFWDEHKSFIYEISGERFLRIMSLESFFTINPYFLGRKEFHVEPTTGAGTPKAVGQTEGAGAGDPKVQ